jgi:hypothetical protein
VPVVNVASFAVLVRIQPPLLEDLDVWISQHDVSFTRPQAIRRLIEIALTVTAKKQTGKK